MADHMRQFIVWALWANGGEGLIILIAALPGISLPILPHRRPVSNNYLWLDSSIMVVLRLTSLICRDEAVFRFVASRRAGRSLVPLVAGIETFWRGKLTGGKRAC